MEKAGQTAAPAYFYMVASPAEEDDYLKGIEMLSVEYHSLVVVQQITQYQGNGAFIQMIKFSLMVCAVAFFYTDKPMANVYTGAYHETTNSGVITKLKEREL